MWEGFYKRAGGVLGSLHLLEKGEGFTPLNPFLLLSLRQMLLKGWCANQ